MVVLTPVTAKKYTFTVDAFNNPEVTAREGTSFKIISTDRKTERDAAQFETVSNYIKTILSSMGYFEAPNKREADLIIDIAFGVDQPHIEFELQKAAPPSARSMVNNPTRRLPEPARWHTYTTPHGQILSNEDRIMPKTIYPKFLKIAASVNQPLDSTSPRVEVWSVTTVNQDANPDLEKYLPLLAAASISYIGQKTNSQETVILRDKSQDVRFIRKGM